MGEDYSHALDSPGSSVTLVGHSSGWGCKAHCPNGLQKCYFRSIAPVGWGRACWWGVALASTHQAPTSDTLTAQMEPQLTPGKCKVYRTYYRTIVGAAAPLRWGDSKFGYRHIRDKHGFRSKRIDWALHNGRVVQQSGSTFVVQGQYPGDRNPFRVVYADNWHSDRCPGELLGIITAYYKSR